MTARLFEDRLSARAQAAGIEVDPRVVAPLHAFYLLLVRWNARINLTALPLDHFPDQTVDRLFIEPLAASPLLLDLPSSAWFDVGSGSGSPAIPLALARRELRLTMVESKARKAAFLNEAVRQLGLNADVSNQRLHELAAAHASEAGLVTVRGVRADEGLRADLMRIAQTGAAIAIFGSADQVSDAEMPSAGVAHRLTPSATLRVYRVPRGTR